MCNVLSHGSIHPSKYRNPPKFPFKQMELIELFITTAKEFGVPDHESFQTVDLFEDQNLFQVVVCLQSLGRKVGYCKNTRLYHSIEIRYHYIFGYEINSS